MLPLSALLVLLLCVTKEATREQRIAGEEHSNAISAINKPQSVDHTSQGESTKTSSPFRPTQDSLRVSSASHETTLPYGNGHGQVGMLHVSLKGDGRRFLVAEEKLQGQCPGCSGKGPESYFVDKDGILHIADHVNERILTFTPEGGLTSTMPLKGQSVNDMIASSRGGYITYDASERKLHSFGTNGELLSSISMSITSNYRGYFHRLDDQIFVVSETLSDVLVATEKNGVLQPADPRTTYRGIGGPSGRRFETGWVDGRSFSLRIWDDTPSTTPLAKAEVELPGALSALFVGETKDGLACVEVQQRKEGKAIIHAFLFDEDGKEVHRVELPYVSHHLLPLRRFDVTPGGDIVQFVPRSEDALVRVFSRSYKGE